MRDSEKISGWVVIMVFVMLPVLAPMLGIGFVAGYVWVGWQVGFVIAMDLLGPKSKRSAW